MRHVGVGLVHVEVLGEGAILDIGEFPAAECGARLRRMAGLRGGIAPIGRDGADHDAVAGTEAFHFRADFMNDADGLVAEREVFTWPDRAMDGMRVGGAYEGAGG